MDPLLGRSLGPYELQARLGGGGMGVVYRAVHRGLGRARAVKVLPPALANDPVFVQRFEREARVAANLHHPHVIPIYDVRHEDGYFYIVMELVEGQSLRDLVQASGRLPPVRIVALLRQLADALDFAHSHGILHRDVKPANVLVGPNDHVTLIDFGIVRAADSSSLTATHGIMGTPAYMAPEIWRGEPPGPGADLYALGVMAFELLAGRVPFDATTTPALGQLHVYTPPPSPRSLAPHLPHAVEQVLFRQLAKQPTERFPTARGFVDALERALVGRPSAELPQAVWPPAAAARPRPTGGPMPGPSTQSSWSARAPAGPPPRRSSAPLLAVGAAVAVLLAVVGAFFALRGPGEPTRTAARPPTPAPAAPTPTSASAVVAPPLLAGTIPTTQPPPTATVGPPTPTSAPPTSTASLPPAAARAPESKPAESGRPWKTYRNQRFSFSISFPDAWPEGVESNNGDGVRLYVGNPDVDIAAFAGLARPDLDPYALRSKPGFRADQVKLDSGAEATLIVGRQGDRVVRELVVVDQRLHYHVYAEVTEAFFKENETVLLRVMQSLTTAPAPPAAAAKPAPAAPQPTPKPADDEVARWRTSLAAQAPDSGAQPVLRFPKTLYLPSRAEPAFQGLVLSKASSSGNASQPQAGGVGYLVFMALPGAGIPGSGVQFEGTTGRAPFDREHSPDPIMLNPDCTPASRYCPVFGGAQVGEPRPNAELFRGLTVKGKPAVASHIVCCNGEYWRVLWFDEAEGVTYEVAWQLDAAAKLGGGGKVDPNNARIAQQLAEVATGLLAVRPT